MLPVHMVIMITMDTTIDPHRATWNAITRKQHPKSINRRIGF